MAALTASDIAALSRLLDEAQAVEPAVREAWLAALPADQAHLAEALREMLAAQQQDQSTHPGPSLQLPTLPDRDEPTARAGERVGPYRLVREIGRGGMGSVWLAERDDGHFQRQVALKLPRLAWADDLAARMAREREIAAQLEHPQIARLYDAGVDQQGRPYLALEYIDGQPIDAWCEAQALSARARLALFVPVVRAVAYAHGRLVVHRDLKPANVLVSRDGQVHLLDFGIAKRLDEAAGRDLTREQGRVLTLHYASPEQVAGEPVSVQSDVYSLGVMLYELLTGTLPHTPRRHSTGAIEDAILAGDAPPASSRAQDKATAKALRGEVDAILAKAMRREPRQRYATADALADDIGRHLAGETVSARPDSLGYRLSKAILRHRGAFAAVCAVAVAVLGGAGSALWQMHRATQAADRQRMVTEFVSDVFRIDRQGTAAPVPAALTGDAFLRHSAQLVSQKFVGEPAMQAQMYAVIANLLLEMGAADEAADYARRRIDALQAASGGGEPAFEAVLGYALALTRADRLADAESQARRALALAGSDPQRQLDALALLARALTWRGNKTEAMQVVDRIDATARALGRPTIAQAWGHALRGAMLSSNNRYPEAAAWYEKALTLATRIEGEESPDAAQMRAQLGRVMLNHGEAKAAVPVLQLAYEVRRRRGGPRAVEADMAQPGDWSRLFLSHAVSHAEASAVIERALETLARVPSLPDRMRHQVGIDRAALAIAWGDVESAWRWMPDPAERLLPLLELPYSRFRVAVSMADLAMQSGEHRLAERWIEERFRAREAMGESRHPFAIYDPIVRAINASMAGRHDEAIEQLQQLASPARFPAGVPEALRAYDGLRQAQARALANAGRHDEAWALVGASPPKGPYRGISTLGGAPLHAELLCQRGRHAEGRALFDELLAGATPDRYPHAPLFAWVRAHAGACALAAGDRAAAQRLAAQARAAFTAQPGVSPYFKAPLLKLEAALASPRR